MERGLDGLWRYPALLEALVSPLGAPDFSSYLLNVANSGADILINVNWGHDAVLSIQQAKQFGVLDKMKLVVPIRCRSWRAKPAA